MSKKFVSTITGGIFLLGCLTSASAAPDSLMVDRSHLYAKNLCHQKGYKCFKVKPGTPWKKLFPNERERKIVMALNRTNQSYAKYNWMVVPTNLKNITQMDVAPFPKQIVPEDKGVSYIIVDLALQAYGAYDKTGKLVQWDPVSSGKVFCNHVVGTCNTPPGKYVLHDKRGKKCKSGKFPVRSTGRGGANMPYCMFFHRGYALHGSPMPGHPASHGCVRTNADGAKWLNHNLVTRDETVIEVIGKTPDQAVDYSGNKVTLKQADK